MEETVAIDRLSALAQPARLAAFRLLVAHEPDGLPAGEIARHLQAPHNTMSANLAVLQRAGLVRSERHGRSILYRADLTGIRSLLSFLVEDCCGGRPEACGPLAPQAVSTCRPAARTAT